MKSSKMFPVFAMLSVSAAAVPTVSDVTVRQVWSDRKVVVTYTLSGGDAIVTADITTNGASVGAVPLRAMAGDVNRLVTAGTGRTIEWQPPSGWVDPAVASLKVGARVTAWTEQEPPDYMVLALDGTQERRYYESEDALPLGIGADEYRTNSLVMRLVRASGRTFRMGAPTDEPGVSSSDRIDGIRITQLSDDYYLGVFEVTQAQYAKVCGSASVAAFSNKTVSATRPMDSIRWADNLLDNKWPDDDEEVAYQSGTGKFFGKLRAVTGMNCRLALPTEAQWEYACRAGSVSALYDGSAMATNELGVCEALDALGRYALNGGLIDGKTTPDFATCGTDAGTARVGSYRPNAWGFYDMLGNVAELCMDMYNYYEEGIALDPAGPAKDKFGTANNRALRGGSWKSAAADCRCASRSYSQMWVKSDGTGFRVCYTIR